jgi:cobalt/nickel transport protein
MAKGEQDHQMKDSPLADYGISGIDNEFLSTGLSGILGVLVTFGIGAGVFWLVRRRGDRGDPGDSGDEAGRAAETETAAAGTEQ